MSIVVSSHTCIIVASSIDCLTIFRSDIDADMKNSYIDSFHSWDTSYYYVRICKIPEERNILELIRSETQNTGVLG